MADPAHVPDLARGGRGVQAHGASDLSLMGPTPLAFGIAGSIALSATVAQAATPGPAMSEPSAAAADRVSTSIDLDLSTGVSAPAMPMAMASVPTPIAAQTVAAQTVAPTIEDGAPYQTSFAAVPPGISMTIAPAVSGAAAPNVNEAVSAVQASADALNSALQNLMGQVAATGHILPVDQVAQTIEALTASVETSATGLVGHTDNLIDAAGSSVIGLATDAATLVDIAGQGAADLVADAGSLVSTSVAALSDTADDLLGTAGTAVAGLATTAGSLLGSATADAGALVDTVGDTATSLLDAAAGPVSDIATGTLALASDATAAVASTAGTLGAELVPTVGDTLDNAVGLVGSIVGTASATATDTDATPLGGTDPAGGISTLTDLLAGDQAFELVSPDLPEPVFATVNDVVAPLDLVTDGDPILPEGGLLDVASQIGFDLLGDKKGLGGLFDHDGGLHG